MKKQPKEDCHCTGPWDCQCTDVTDAYNGPSEEKQAVSGFKERLKEKINDKVDQVIKDNNKKGIVSWRDEDTTITIGTVLELLDTTE